ncbi:13930_t:CDS:2 [Ambispora leptoticha]|uniref:13930_t:CDS:1 n=1 Tax=Ambispora leptoticha TaxID=144679 RepID=A0A9N9BQT8_9GLOM|nr:13930_t:CDS:2 [Ambispora leptoticha]
MGHRLSKLKKILFKQTSQNVIHRPNIIRRETGSEILVEVLQIFPYRVIEGRIFLVDNERYVMPCDIPEKERLVTQHELYKRIWNDNFSSPIHERLNQGGMRVLDVGCGSGAWILDMAKEYPASTFLGIDIMETSSDIMQQPPNAGFLQFNVLNGLPFPDETFDFVYQRFLWAAFTPNQWIQLIHELIRVTKKNGRIELMEIEAKIHNPGPIAKKFSDAAQQHLTSNGIDPKIYRQIRNVIVNSNKFESIKIFEKRTPLGNWQQASHGIKSLENTVAALKSLQVAFKAVLGVDDHEYKAKGFPPTGYVEAIYDGPGCDDRSESFKVESLLAKPAAETEKKQRLNCQSSC